MTLRIPLLAFFCLFGLEEVSFAQTQQKKDEKKAAPQKSPADLALDEFNKVRNEGGAKDQARFHKVIAAGIAYITQNPTHGGVNGAINNLAFYGSGIDKKTAGPMRGVYASQLGAEVTNQKYKEGVSDATKAALAALEAAIADFEMRESITRDTLATYREKVDALAEVPGAGRFLADRERSYVHILAAGFPGPRAEEHAKKLLEHKEKGVKDMARAELNILEAKKEPYALKFTGIDGKETDFAQLRGKVVALYFWSSTNKGSTDRLEQIRQICSDNKKKGLELVTVSLDKEEDREKLTKFLKENRVTVPVYFDGKGSKTEFVSKLNVYSVPRLLIFDQKGTLFTTFLGAPLAQLTSSFEPNQLQGIFTQLTAPAKK